MAAEVTGQIVGTDGSKDVFLNNAATEATLRALLAATAKTEAGIKKAMDLASKAGLNVDTVRQVDQGLTNVAGSSNTLSTDLAATSTQASNLNIKFTSLLGITEQLVSGSASLSGILGSMSQVLPKSIGSVISGIVELAKFQETSLKTYQSLNDAGASFGGSLYDMRMAAASSYLTLDEFSKLIKANSSVFANMGGTVTQSTKSFAVFANDFIKGDLGIGLMNLGYSFEDLNQGALNYISISGGRNAKEMADKDKLGQSTAEYLEQLDRIADITGKSRKQQEEDAKKLLMTPVWENYIAKLKVTSPEVSDRLTKAAVEIQGRFGDQAARVFQAQQLNQLGMLNKADLAYMALTQSAGASLTGYTEYVKTGAGNLNDISSNLEYSMGNAASQFEGIGGVLVATNSNMAGVVNSTLKASTAQINLTDATGRALTREEFIAKRRDAIADQNEKRHATEIESANKSALAIKNLGISILSNLETPIKLIGPIIKTVVDRMGLILGGLVALYAATKYAEYKIRSGSTVGAGATGLVSRFGTPGLTFSSALWVKIVPGFGGLPGSSIGNSGGGTALETAAERRARREATVAAGRESQFRGRMGVGAGLGAIALGTAGNIAAEKGQSGLATGLDIASSALNGATLGAEIGLLGGPFAAISAPVGALVGGAVGLITGLVQNQDKIFDKSKDEAGKEKISAADQQLLDEIARLTALQTEANRLANRHVAIASDHYDYDQSKPISVADNSNNRSSKATWNGAMRPAAAS